MRRPGLNPDTRAVTSGSAGDVIRPAGVTAAFGRLYSGRSAAGEHSGVPTLSATGAHRPAVCHEEVSCTYTAGVMKTALALAVLLDTVATILAQSEYVTR